MLKEATIRNAVHAAVRPVLGILTLSLVGLTPAAANGEVRWRSGAIELAPQDVQELEATVATLAARPQARHVVVQFDQPVGSQERADLEAAGLRLLSYLGDNAFFAAIDARRADPVGISRVHALTAVEPIQQTWKLHPDLIEDRIPPYAIVENVAKTSKSEQKKGPGLGEVKKAEPREAAEVDPIVAAYVLFHGDVPLASEARDIALRHRAVIRSDLYTINGLVIELPLSEIKPLADEDAVQWIEPPLPKFSELNNSNRARVGADIVQNPPYGLNGSGVDVLVYDGGYGLASHVDFGGRLHVRDSSGLADHSTHVAGTIGGSGAGSGGTYKGMAPAVTFEAYGFEQEGGLHAGFLYTDPGDLQDDYNEAINVYGADISNNSIGSNVEPNGFDCSWQGDYGVTAQLIDSIVKGSLGAPFRVVWANGNERQGTRCNVEGYGDYYSIAPPAGAKNHLTVGALNSNDDSVTDFTSWGPTDDGRMKPDVSGPGCQSNDDFGVTSCSSSGGYTTMCGTSMASPTVCGLGALLLQDFRNQYPGEPDFRNSTLKVLLAHTAVDVANPGPDYQTGYGSVRIQPAVDLMRSGNFLEAEVDQGETFSVLAIVNPGDTEVKVTLAWDDAPGTPNVSPSLVNNLDLRVFDASNNQYYVWRLNPTNPGANAVRTAGADSINNIEQVVIDETVFGGPVAPGAYRIEVYGTSVPVGPQPFSLAATPMLVACSPQGIISLDRNKYACASTATIQVVDCDLNTDDQVVETVPVTIDSDSEPGGETVILTETGPETAAFRGSIDLDTTDSAGVLLVASGDTVTATYIDADNGQGGTNVVVTDTATVDCDSPLISNVQISDVNPRDATVTFDTDEAANGTVRYGLSCGSLTETAQEAGFHTAHTFQLTGLEDNTTYYLAVDAEDEAGNAATDDNGGSCYSFTTPEVPDFFTEEFAASDNDLDNFTIMFEPNGSVDFYSACGVPIDELPTPPGGTPITLSDDSYQAVTLSGATVSLYGVSYSTFYVGSNGYITFTAGDSDYDETLAEHFELPRIALLYDDLNPSSGGTVRWQQLSDRAVVTWENVPEYNTTDSNTFQVEMYFDGRLQISFLTIDATDGIAGLSEGEGLSPDFYETDLSAVGDCIHPPVAQNQAVTTAINTAKTITLVATDDGLPDPPAAVTYIITALPTYELRDTQQNHVIQPGELPYTLANLSNEVTYKPGLAYQGPDSFQFKANDGGTPPEGGDSNVATVSITIGGPQQAYVFDLNSNPGWSAQGQWAFGQPTGGGSHNGDPDSGHTGVNVYGYNLAGDYPNSMSGTMYLTTTALDCSQLTQTELRFWRWLGVESSTWDHANLQVSNDGTNWTTVWEHSGTSMSEAAWSSQELNISAVADGQSTVYIRWGMGPTDGSVTYPGWNIDDIEIWGLVQSSLTGDFDGDGDVDLDDFAIFGQCFAGADNPPAVDCPPGVDADLDGDGDVDLDDFAVFGQNFTGAQ